MGGWCGKISNYMGHWCPTKSNYMGGWYFAAWKGKKEYYLPKKERSFIKSSQKKALSEEMTIFVYTQSSNLGCFCRILVKNGTEINSPMNYSQNVPKSKRPLVKRSPKIGHNVPMVKYAGQNVPKMNFHSEMLGIMWNF